MDVPDEPEVSFLATFRLWADSLPPDLRETLGAYLDQRFIEAMEADLAVVDEQIKAKDAQRVVSIAFGPAAGRIGEVTSPLSQM